MPTATLMPLPAGYTQKPMRPLRDSPVLLPGLPLPDSRRTAHDFDVLLLSTSLTCSEHEPLWRMLQLRLAVDAVETPVVLPEYVGLVTKWPTPLAKLSGMVDRKRAGKGKRV